jgi:hypothetical protein
MLHTSNPEAYVRPENLDKDACCPECGVKTIVACGVLHVGHYNAGSEVKSGLIWTCSNRCFLAWEHPRFMGSC